MIRTQPIWMVCQMLCILFFGGQIGMAEEASESAVADRFTVRGSLLKSDGAPIPDEELYLVEADRDTRFGRRTINPAIVNAVAAARTNENGEFLLEAKRSQFEDKKIMFAIIFRSNVFSRGVFTDKDGGVVFELGNETEDMDLGKVVVE